jgi:hypothetical protein
MMEASRLKLYTSASVNCITISFFTATGVPVLSRSPTLAPQLIAARCVCGGRVVSRRVRVWQSTSPEGLVDDAKGTVAERLRVKLELLVGDLVVRL